MRTDSSLRVVLTLACLLLVAGPASPLLAQFSLPGIQVGGTPADDAPPYKLTAVIRAAANGKPAVLAITAKLSPGWKTYSITQQAGGPVRTKIAVTENPDFKLAGDFKPTPAPKITVEEALYKDLPIESHTGTVTWSAPIQPSAGVDLAQLKIAGKITFQVCNDQTCLPPEPVKFEATLAGTAPPQASAPAASAKTTPLEAEATAFKADGSHVTLRGYLEPPASGVSRLVLSAEPAAGFHVYPLQSQAPKGPGPRPTLIVLTETTGLRFKRAVASATPVEGKTPDNQVVTYYPGSVEWVTEIEIPKDTKTGEHTIAGLIGYQACSSQTCDMPKAARFQVKLSVGTATSTTAIPVAFNPASYIETVKLIAASGADQAPASTSAVPTSPAESTPPADKALSLPVVVLFSLLGGLILNIMPCVLPVIGLKILSFVEQGGHNRGRILSLNLWYSLGLLSVFMVLATLSTFLNLGWGQQFGSTAFNVVMVAVLFVMALSFLGVWEIPIPGFVGSGKATEIAGREGMSGAFAKGALTTILATPCSGPFLGPVFGYTLKQPAYVTYLVFGFIGLGMALPYLLIGAFPRLIKFLPKPGEWMDTFKQMLAFVLLGTIVYMFTFLNKNYLVPTFAMLVGLWAGCWWIGRTPLWAESHRKVLAYAQGGIFAGLVGWFAFTSLVPGVVGKNDLPWRDFSPKTLAQLTSEGKTVLVDFTADWCPNCKTNLAFAINTPEVKKVVESTGVVPLLADWTTISDEIKEVLASLGSNSIPVLAIYPAGQPDRPIILRDLISEGQVLEALTQAGPSKAGGDTGNKVTAMR